MKKITSSCVEDGRRAPKCGRWALWLYLGPFLVPLLLLATSELFGVGSLGFAMWCVVILIFAGLPCCLASFLLGIIGLIRKEHPTKPAVLSIAFSIGPVIFGAWVLRNYLVMGEPW